MKLTNLFITTILFTPFLAFAQNEEVFTLEPDPQVKQLDERALGNEEENPFLGFWCEPISGMMNIETIYNFKENREITILGQFNGVFDASRGAYELKHEGRFLVYQISQIQVQGESIRFEERPTSSIAQMTNDGRIRLFSGSLIEEELFENKEFTNFSDILSQGYDSSNDRFLAPCKSTESEI